MPEDPMMLLSFVNTALRDSYQSLEDFCKAMNVNAGEIEEKLAGIDYTYDAALNKFV